MTVPQNPKIYHIVHVDRLPYIIEDGFLWCDSAMAQRSNVGTTIGMDRIKQRRLERPLSRHMDLHVGDCVPFYFCPRSVMLYVIHGGNHHALSYRGGQEAIIHLEADLRQATAWANYNKRRWAFTSSNAASGYADHFYDLENLDELDWDAINARQWQDRRDRKQAEFLVEAGFPWKLISRVGVGSEKIRRQVSNALNAVRSSRHHWGIRVEVRREWYY